MEFKEGWLDKLYLDLREEDLFFRQSNKFFLVNKNLNNIILIFLKNHFSMG
jgi:hypothetical protein